MQEPKHYIESVIVIFRRLLYSRKAEAEHCQDPKLIPDPRDDTRCLDASCVTLQVVGMHPDGTNNANIH